MLASSRLPKLIYHDSDGVDKVINLGAEPLLIGRATECHIQTQDAMVSRRHARIVWDGNYVIEDLGSSNGVYVGNEKVQRAPIRPGDTVTCGSLVLRLMPDTSPRMNPAPTAATPMAGTPILGGSLPPPSAESMATVSPSSIARSAAANATTGQNQSSQLLLELDREKQRRTRAEEAIVAAAERVKTAEARSAELEAAAKDSAPLKRKIEQLTADLKRAKAGVTEETRDEGERQARLAAETERDQLQIVISELERRLAGASTASPDPEKDRLKRDLKQAGEELRRLKAGGGGSGPGGLDPAAADTVILLSDALAELRGSLRAASGEAVLLKEPEESAQVVQDALKSAAEQLEGARSNLRALAKLLGV